MPGAQIEPQVLGDPSLIAAPLSRVAGDEPVRGLLLQAGRVLAHPPLLLPLRHLIPQAGAVRSLWYTLRSGSTAKALTNKGHPSTARCTA